jgi:uncharacterized OB-fold protein
MSQMSEVRAFTIESFYKYVSEGKLMGAKCNSCGALFLPPKPICTKCFSKDLTWMPVDHKGTLLTYTVIHVSPKQFETQTPYPLGIVKLDEGLQLLGMIRGVEPDKLKVGMELTVDFEKTPDKPAPESEQWPSWPRYYFKPASSST